MNSIAPAYPINPGPARGAVNFLGWGVSSEKLQVKYLNSESKFINIDGFRVHYRDEGKGPVLLCLHGIVSSLHTWDGWVDALKNRYRIIRIDVPGWGMTSLGSFSFKRDDYMIFLKKFVDALGIKKLYLAGNSLGGYLSWNFALDYPKLVKKLILLDPAGYPQKVPGAVKLFTMPIFRTMGTSLTPKFLVLKFVREVYGDKKRICKDVADRYFELLVYGKNRKNCVKIFDELKFQARFEPSGVNRIKTPTLLMWGEKDIWIPLSIMERFKKDLPHARVITYPGVGHVPMEEIPDITARDAGIFLSEK